MTPAIELRGVTKRFLTPSGGVYTALRDLNMTVEPGEFCAVVGPTGCGKSTTLALISGLEPASEGEVDVFGSPVNGIAACPTVMRASAPSTGSHASGSAASRIAFPTSCRVACANAWRWLRA